MRRFGSFVLLAGVLALAAGCTQVADKGDAASASAKPAVAQAAAPAKPLKVELTDKDFGCIRDMRAVRHFYVANALGDLEGTLKIANNPGSGDYPVGSVLQLVPGEVMVKREAGYSAASRDWEFIELDVSPQGSKIRVRGTTEAVNRFGGNCLTCHIKARPEFDLVCDQTHGCDPIPISRVMAQAIQNTDPRCAKIDLPPEQVDALKALAAFSAAARPPQPAQ
jgi:hypothetical protein